MGGLYPGTCYPEPGFSWTFPMASSFPRGPTSFQVNKERERQRERETKRERDREIQRDRELE